MDDIEIKNAKITSVFVGYEDHGIFTCNVGLEYDGGGQSFGGYALDAWDEKEKKRIGTAYGLEWLVDLLRTLDIRSIDELRGIPVRVEASWNKVHKIGHFLKEQWFNPEELRYKYYGKS